MKVAIIGSREIGDFSVASILPHIPVAATELVSGGALGIDSLAEDAARLLGLPITVFLPDYSIAGSIAPLIRNQKIVAYADLVLAFWDNRSRGTANTLSHCIEQGKPFRIIPLHPVSL